jgi:hypothetical protein
MAKLSEAQLAKDLRAKEAAFNQSLTACLKAGVVVGPMKVRHDDGTETLTQAPIGVSIENVITSY